MNIEFSTSSMLQSPVIVDTDAGTATLTYKNSGKDYTYNIDNNFVTDLQETITNDQSVGKFILAARADRRLTEVVSVWIGWVILCLMEIAYVTATIFIVS